MKYRHHVSWKEGGDKRIEGALMRFFSRVMKVGELSLDFSFNAGCEKCDCSPGYIMRGAHESFNGMGFWFVLTPESDIETKLNKTCVRWEREEGE